MGTRRQSRFWVLNKMPQHARCAEIGVWRGRYSRSILSVTKPKELHLIDPWIVQPEFPSRWYGGTNNYFTPARFDQIYQDVIQRFKDHPNVKVHRGKSADVLPTFPDHYFDWVYIDGNHYYEFVLQDLELCLQKIKPEGYITGDDWRWRPSRQEQPVKQAVTEFVEQWGLTNHLEVFHNQYVIHLKRSALCLPSCPSS